MPFPKVLHTLYHKGSIDPFGNSRTNEILVILGLIFMFNKLFQKKKKAIEKIIKLALRKSRTQIRRNVEGKIQLRTDAKNDITNSVDHAYYLGKKMMTCPLYSDQTQKHLNFLGSLVGCSAPGN